MAVAKPKFDLSAMMETVSNLDTTAAAPRLEMIALENIVVNKDNFYQLSNLGALADSIAMEGLQQPLVVTPLPTQEGKYRLISGHRRRAAIESLVKDKAHPREDLRLIPCMVKSYSSPAMEELQLILANSTARVLTNAEIMKQASKMEMLLYQLKEEGYEFPGRMRDQVAAACKVSAPKLARLKVIEKNLISDFMYLFQKDRLSEQAAYALARLPVEFQSRISSSMGQTALHGYGAERILSYYNKGWRWDAKELSCPDGKACKRGDTFLRHDLEHGHDMCGGNKCCLKCSRALERYSPCDRMCSKAKAQRKEEKDDREAKELAAKAERSKEHEAESQKNAQRLLRAIEAAGLPDDAKFRWREYWSLVSVSTVRKWAAGEFAELLTEPKLNPKRLEEPAALAALLGCSTDYLLGLTDDLTPVAYAANAEPEAVAPADVTPAPAPQATKESSWIQLCDRAPSYGQLCFAIDGDAEVWYAKYLDGDWMDANWSGVDIPLADQNVSHWMPAPELPQEVAI